MSEHNRIALGEATNLMTRRYHILMVEDQADDAEITSHILNRYGVNCDIQRVENRQSFEAAIRTPPPAAILCDFSLPGFSGLEAFDIARRVTPDTPFIFFSGSEQRPDIDPTRISDATAVVSKDRYQHLVTLLRRSLGVESREVNTINV